MYFSSLILHCVLFTKLTEVWGTFFQIYDVTTLGVSEGLHGGLTLL
jgi:hypothetical protein